MNTIKNGPILNEYKDSSDESVFLSAAALIDLNYFTENEILHEICNYYLKQYKKSVLEKKIKPLSFYVTIKNIFENFIRHPRGISLTFNNNFYAKLPKRYNPNKITAYKLKRVVEFLEDQAVLKLYKGFQSGKVSFYSRIIPNTEILILLRDTGLTPLKIEFDRNMERIILKTSKDEGKRLTDYSETIKVGRLRKFILNYEAFINQWEFKSGKEKLGRIYFKRVFNNSSFKSGGRYYSNYQSIKSKKRVTETTCSGIQMREWDFSGLHINMLYALENLGLYEGDVYTIEGYEEFRDLFKVALQIAINAKNKRSAYSGMNQHLRKNGVSSDIITAKKLLSLFTLKHGLISKYFFSGIGLSLQNMDSEIVTRVLRDAKRLKIPILPVHDSFLGPIDKEDEIIAIMNNAALKIMGVKFKIDSK